MQFGNINNMDKCILNLKPTSVKEYKFTIYH